MRLLLLALLLAPSFAAAQGLGGRQADRLDAPGSPTDRYLESSEIREALHAANDAFFQCFRQAAGSRGGVGDVSVDFVIERSGATSHAEVDLGSDLPGLADCLELAVAGIVFDEHDGDPVEVAYPTVYVVDRQGARFLDYPVVFTRPRPVRLPLLLLPPDVTHGEVLLLERLLTHDEPVVEAPPTVEPVSDPASASDESPPPAPGPAPAE